MSLLRFFVIALYYFAAFVLVLTIAEFLFPEMVLGTAFSALTLISIFFLAQADTVLNLGPLESDKKVKQ